MRMNFRVPFLTTSFGGAGASGVVAASHGPAADQIASLDGLRAIAIACVFLAHGGLSQIVPGGLGVTLFFVLSGFLITTLMRAEWAATGTLDLRAFYQRRFLRLMPPLLIVLTLTLLLDACTDSRTPATWAGVASVVFYFSNYFSILYASGVPDGLGVTWSLAVEEHFYIVFPLLALLLLRVRRVASVAPLGLLCLAVLAWRCWLLGQGAAPSRIYMGTDTRIDSILVGCVMALLCNPVLDPVHPRVRRHSLSMTLLLLGVLAGTLVYRSEYFRSTFRFTIQSLALAPLIYLAVAQSRHAAFRWLNAAPLVYLGRISYTVYLVHQSCMLFVTGRWPVWGTAATLAASAVLTLAVAVPMRRWVDLPCAGLRRRLHRRRVIAVPGRADGALLAYNQRA
jgi:peptidoglycan/LPS O-acetylase OafA/YrhL